jgi:phosphatidylserine/phosphatidylglycerophosphate/cardiolipin synthase-like enzyme
VEPATSSLEIQGAPFLESSTLRVEGAEAFSLLTWYVNGAPALAAGRELTGRHFDKHDRIGCEAARYVDGRRETRWCREVRIDNSLPGSRLPWEPLEAAGDGWDDPDGDHLQLRAIWYVNDMPVPETSSTFRSWNLLPGDRIVAELAPFDGEAYGPSVRSLPAVIAPVETPVRILDFAGNATAVVPGKRLSLRWQTEGAESCTLAGETLLPELLSLGVREVEIDASTVFDLDCFGSGGPVSAQWSVFALPLPPGIDFFEPATPVINYGETTTLVWSVTEADDCKLQGVAMDGTATTVQPLADSEYALTCRGSGGVVTATATVAVRRPRINEVAWMGTTADVNDEWIELYNAATVEIDLDGWRLRAQDGTPDILFDGAMPAGAYWLLERSDDNAVADVAADRIFTGGLGNSGEALELLDSYGRVVDRIAAGAWPAGDSASKAAMERLGSRTSAEAWATSTVPYSGGLGTPRAPNSKLGYPTGGTSLTNIQVWTTGHLNSRMPAHGPGEATDGLIAAIDGAQSSIDFALYGIQGSPEVRDALQHAVARGVIVRGVVDADTAGWYAYRNTRDLIAELPPGAVRADTSDALMHNKFFVVDQKRVWTGTANLSDAGLNAEYNCNVVLLIDSAPLAAAYTAEFEQMYAGAFHRRKQRQTATVFPRLPGGTLVEAYFAPQGDARSNAIIRATDAATQTIDAMVFFLTDAAVAAALVDAHLRGVTVRLIIDAVGAGHPASRHGVLRAAGIPVKVEDWAGKAHTKMLVADGYVSVIGSQNWTEAGNRENDENTLYLENGPLASLLQQHFEADWVSIPERWLAADPRAESADSPGTLSDLLDNDSDGLVDEGAPEKLVYVNDAAGALNAYFNKSVLAAFATPGNQANSNVRFAERFLYRLNAVTQAVEMTAYELNEPALVAGLLDKAAAGVTVRMVVDGKAPPPTDAIAIARYEQMRLQLERLARGSDGALGTADDVLLLADSPVFAVENPGVRVAAGLVSAATDLPSKTVWVGNGQVTGRLLADAERKPGGATYYAAGEQMHHKFALFDKRWVWTGSWNPVNDGSGWITSDQAVELHSPDVAAAFLREFETMWGGAAREPNPLLARFHGRKPGTAPQTFTVGGRKVEVLFSPGGELLQRLREVAAAAEEAAYFTIFAWSDQELTNILKERWEGSREAGNGERTGFQLAGVFDRAFWDQWWSASADMRGIQASDSAGNPAVPWAHRPPVVSDGEDRTLHTKVFVFDPDGANPVVVFGSANWGNNGSEVNDDHMLVIHDRALANQFMQHVWARYFMGGGRLPE